MVVKAAKQYLTFLFENSIASLLWNLCYCKVRNFRNRVPYPLCYDISWHI